MSSGIYKIVCVPTGKLYIGSSKNIENRIYRHKNSLRKGHHINKYLQSAWDKHGEDSFTFATIEECDVDLLIIREQIWLDTVESYKREIGFNQSDKAICNTNSKRYIVIAPCGKEYDVQNLEQFCRDNSLEKTGLHKVANGELNQYKGWYCRHHKDTHKDWINKRRRGVKSGPGWKGGWKIIREDGAIFIAKSLNGFAKEHNLRVSGLQNLATGHYKSSQGFIRIEKCVV